MIDADDMQDISAVADRVESLLSWLDEETSAKVFSYIQQEITYRAAIEQARCVEPPGGWDPLGR